MQATSSPSPCPRGQSYTVTASGGVPPYAFQVAPSPPNPPGVEIEVDGSVATVTFPPGTAPQSQVSIAVYDSGDPRHGVVSTNKVV